MKLLKNTLAIAALCSIGLVDARTGKKPASRIQIGAQRAVKPAPQEESAPAAQSFSYYLGQIRKMPANKVIDADGIFTNYFENFVRLSGLEPELMRELLEAGKNLYLPLSGNAEQDETTIAYAGERIDGVMSGMRGEETGLGWEGTVVSDITKEAEQITAKMNDINAKMRQIQDISAKNQVADVNAKMNAVNQKIQQIKDINNASPNQIERQAAEVTTKMDDINKKIQQIQEQLATKKVGVRGTPLSQEAMGGAEEILRPISLQPLAPMEDLQLADMPELYYDEQNAVLKQSYLEMRANELLATKTAPETINILLPELTQLMRKAWADNNIQSVVTRTRELEKQIKDTVNRLALTPARKIGTPIRGKLLSEGAPGILIPQPSSTGTRVTDKSIMTYLAGKLAQATLEYLDSPEYISNLADMVESELNVKDKARIKTLIDDALDIKRAQLRKARPQFIPLQRAPLLITTEE